MDTAWECGRQYLQNEAEWVDGREGRRMEHWRECKSTRSDEGREGNPARKDGMVYHPQVVKKRVVFFRCTFFSCDSWSQNARFTCILFIPAKCAK